MVVYSRDAKYLKVLWQEPIKFDGLLIVAVLLLDTGANTGTGTNLIEKSTSSLGLKSPGNKVDLSCVRFSHDDADDAETLS